MDSHFKALVDIILKVRKDGKDEWHYSFWKILRKIWSKAIIFQ